MAKRPGWIQQSDFVCKYFLERWCIKRMDGIMKAVVIGILTVVIAALNNDDGN